MDVEWSAPATRDAGRIASYIAEENPAAAKKVMRIIYEKCGALALFPLRGRQSHMEGYRDLVLSPLPFIAVYRVTETAVIILRIFHSAQHWP